MNDDTLTEIRNRRLQLSDAQRACVWSLGDLEADAIRVAGRQILPDLAADTGESVSTLRARVRSAVAFPAPMRGQIRSLAPTTLREVLEAANRLGESPEDVAVRVAKSHMSCQDVRRLGTAEERNPPLEPPRCPTCGGKPRGGAS
jgi:hypothetical protein